MPASSVATARCACSSANCRSSAGAISCAAIVRARSRPVAGNVLRAPLDRLDERAAFARVLRRETSSAPAPCRSGTPAARAPRARAACMRPSSPSSCFAYDCSRARYASASAAFSIAMIAVEEARDVEIGADVLNDDVRRVAPAADRDVAVGQREAFERRRIGAAHDLDAGARGMREAARVEGVDALQVGANLRRHPLLSLRGAIGQLRSKRRPRAGVDAERGRALRQQAKEIVGRRCRAARARRPRLRARRRRRSRRARTRTPAAGRRRMPVPRSLHGGSARDQATARQPIVSSSMTLNDRPCRRLDHSRRRGPAYNSPTSHGHQEIGDACPSRSR